MCVGVWLPLCQHVNVSFCEYVCVCARNSYREEEGGGGGEGTDWDKGLCSHECHTNKAQSDIEVQAVR